MTWRRRSPPSICFSKSDQTAQTSWQSETPCRHRCKRCSRSCKDLLLSFYPSVCQGPLSCLVVSTLHGIKHGVLRSPLARVYSACAMSIHSFFGCLFSWPNRFSKIWIVIWSVTLHVIIYSVLDVFSPFGVRRNLRLLISLVHGWKMLPVRYSMRGFRSRTLFILYPVQLKWQWAKCPGRCHFSCNTIYTYLPFLESYNRVVKIKLLVVKLSPSVCPSLDYFSYTLKPSPKRRGICRIPVL